MRPITTILVANRGEIAARIFRTARHAGYRTVAVYSEADRHAPFVAMADRSVALGAGDPAATYLDSAKLIAAAIASGADAIHPGYGFLAENAPFAQACAQAAIVFIGPNPETIALMGDKAKAKAHMRQHGVPVVPGYDGADQSDATLIAQATALGFPLLIKAVAGGGGRGIRRLSDPADVNAALAASRREAHASFGDDRLMLEKCITSARHIEVQICGDQFANIVHLGDRDCTAQRRRQKILEESPAASLPADVRAALHSAAVNAARSVGYLGIGTIEFILDDDNQFYFLEMNTRIQVEHTITEAITGLDLVDWQLRIAEGEALPCQQDEITLSGHAIEARLCAEDPDRQFAPQTGTIHYWQPIAAAPGVRIDAGIIEGGIVTPYYDPMLAKIIAHGRTRADAIRRLESALAQSPLLGLATNGGFLIDVLGSAEFRNHRLRVDTLDTWRPAKPTDHEHRTRLTWALAAALCAGLDHRTLYNRQPAPLEFNLASGEQQQQCRITTLGQHWHITIGQTPIILDSLTHNSPNLDYRAGGVGGRAIAVRYDDLIAIAIDGYTAEFRETSPGSTTRDPKRNPQIRAPLSGRLIMCASEGDTLEQGAPLALIEAMKMETAISAPAACRVRVCDVQKGTQISGGDLIMMVDYLDPSEVSHG